MKTVAIVQARMNSARLPGKILKTVLGKSLLEYQIERLRTVGDIDEIVVATTTHEIDSAVVSACEKLNVAWFRGSEENVLERFYLCAKAHHANVIIRVTSDCPVIDPEVLAKTLLKFKSGPYDYVSNTLVRSFPRGLDVEVFSFAALEQCFKNATLPAHREHVTSYIYENPERFRLGGFSNESDQSHHRWTVDTPEDFQLIRLLIEGLYPANPNFLLSDLLHILSLHPEWQTLNAHIEQKKASGKVIAIRTDASLQIGTGHVIRCLTLGQALRSKGMQCIFIVRNLKGNLNQYIQSQDFKVLELPAPVTGGANLGWAEVSSDQDAGDTIAKLKLHNITPDLLIVDHYAFSETWHTQLRPCVKGIVVIDDLADRPLNCDLLIDANFPAKGPAKYASLLPNECEVLSGPEFTFLKNEFVTLRQSLNRNFQNLPRNLIVFFGGIDATNETSKVLHALIALDEPELKISVVIGESNPHRIVVEKLTFALPGAQLHIQTDQMAMLMARAQLCFGAGGTAAWERLCLGLPTITICIAENQRESLALLSEQGFVFHLGEAADVTQENIINTIRPLLYSKENLKTLQQMSIKGLQLIDGLGVARVTDRIQKLLMKQ